MDDNLEDFPTIMPDEGFNYNMGTTEHGRDSDMGGSSQSGSAHPPHDQKYKRKHHRDFDFNFSEMSRDEAKSFAHTFINYLVILTLFCTSCFYIAISACCFCTINKVKTLQKYTEHYVDTHPPMFTGAMIEPAAPQPNFVASPNSVHEGTGFMSRGNAIN
jgi:hypothetical protein